ncbi:hypothetical protein F5Y18DRAFT_60874 [Xylariaceae sp. FL1019]|nr:hypothetical protein F5Y18DRAFT_60874 [Xylariaceae sp. FL1019]
MHGQQSSLYNGVSSRSRGWKTRKTEKEPDISATSSTILKWDGASRSSEVWDNLRRDPELWYRNGNCYVHLYGKGQSKRGPSFKVPFSTLLEAQCHPLINSYISDESDLDDAKSGPFQLFIPAPPQSEKRQSYNYHLATRNFFAFIFRRSMAGETLGSALIGLMHSMAQFRSQTANNEDDLLNYMDEEGYLDMNCQPNHALAMLRLSEEFQIRELYINAFTHCCGMANLLLGSEYQLLSSMTRNSIRKARLEMERRLAQSSKMLRSFVQDELSEANMDLYPGARAHIERFRTLLHGLYAARFGYYPPQSGHSSNGIFEVDVLRTMRYDFEALYDYLVDEGFDTTRACPSLIKGGISALQSIQSFDARYGLNTLPHPLPLLPEVTETTISPRRISWVKKPSKTDPSQRCKTLAALLVATNSRRTDVVKSPLVRAYRKFEEDSVYSPTKADRMEGLGLSDARKVRWILIYAMYQILRQATEVPSEVQDTTAPYHLCIAKADIPSWPEQRPTLLRSHSLSGQVDCAPSLCSTDLTSRSSSPAPPSLEIRPDIDYLANQRSEVRERTAGKLRRNPSLINSLANPMSRTSSSVRRSFSFLKPFHNETAVRGYANDMEKTHGGPAIARGPSLSHHDNNTISSISDASHSSLSYSNSDAGSSESSHTSVSSNVTQSTLETREISQQLESVCTRCGHHEFSNASSNPSLGSRQYTTGDRTSNDRLIVQRLANVHIKTSFEPAPLNIRKNYHPNASDYVTSVMEAEDRTSMD